jgi:UDP-N-acetylglucosamine transferase subunit ALG13
LIFVTVGSQKFQFNRLLKEIDKLVEEKRITEEVFAQTGYSDYEPENYKYKNFLDRDEFSDVMSRCDKVITHGGTGAIIGAVKQGKKVIAVPRLKDFGEHVDDHQLQIIGEFEKMNFIKSVNEIEQLDSVISNIINCEFNQYESNTQFIIESIENFVNIQNFN